ncbi:MAG: hypothetical protein K8R76_03980 [Candidatus Aegiribacteria sp.]|nr:hypothetical protein [Candidatus Aegiribacteria sp.]
MQNNIGNSFAGNWLRSIACNLRKIMVLCIIVAVASAVWALTRDKRWSASAIAMVPGESGSLSQMAGLGTITGDLLPGGLGGLGSALSAGTPGGMDINLVQQILSSRIVIERVMLKYDFFDYFKSPNMDIALERMRKWIAVELTPEGLIVISAEGRSREEAAAMVNDIITFANDELSVIITSRARRSRILAEESVETAEESLLVAQNRMERFREETGLIFPEEQGSQTIELLGTLETELLLAEAELSGVSGTMSYSSSAYSEIAREVAFLRNTLNTRMTSGDSLSLFPGLDSIPSMLKEFENISINLETRRIIYLMLRQELESLRLEEVKESPTLEVLVPAVPMALRSYPKRAMLVITNTFLTFILSLLWLAVVTYAKQLLEGESTGDFWRSILKTTGKQLFLIRDKKRGSGEIR